MRDMRCPFEGAILSGRFGCRFAEKFLVAHREGIVCGEAGAYKNCEELVGCLTENAAFGLRLPRDRRKLTHGQEMRVRVGGLIGLTELLYKECSPTSNKRFDIACLIQVATEQHRSIKELPYARIMPSIQAYRLRSS